MKLSNTLYGLTLLPNGVSTDRQWNRHFYRPSHIDGLMFSGVPWPACDQLPPRRTRGQWHDSPGIQVTQVPWKPWVVQQAMFDCRFGKHTSSMFKQLACQRTKRYPRCYLIDIHLSLKMDKEHQETLQHGFWS